MTGGEILYSDSIDNSGCLFGGYSDSGNAASNSVNISQINDEKLTVIGGNIYGGVASSTGYANYNQVNISTGTLKIVYGGFSEAGNVASNSINISGDSTKINYVYGGYVKSGTGSASYNLVNISGGTINGEVSGGYSYMGGSVASNSVNISGGTVTKNVFGGFSHSGNTSSNTVNISGDTTSILGNIYGGVASIVTSQKISFIKVQ